MVEVVDQIMVLDQVEQVELAAAAAVDKIHHLHPQQEQEQSILEEAVAAVDNLLVELADQV